MWPSPPSFFPAIFLSHSFTKPRRVDLESLLTVSSRRENLYRVAPELQTKTDAGGSALRLAGCLLNSDQHSRGVDRHPYRPIGLTCHPRFSFGTEHESDIETVN